MGSRENRKADNREEPVTRTASVNKVGFSKRNNQSQLLASIYTHVPIHMQTSTHIHIYTIHIQNKEEGRTNSGSFKEAIASVHSKWRRKDWWAKITMADFYSG